MIKKSLPVLTLVLVLLAAPAAHAGKGKGAGGNAHYSYKVVGFQYNALGDLVADFNPGFCNPVESSSWIGHVEAHTDDLALTSGKGALHIFSDRTSGEIKARTSVQSSLINSEHTAVIACDMGQATDFATTQCADQMLAPATGFFRFDAGPGNRIMAFPTFRVTDEFNPGWIDNRFICVERLNYGRKADQPPAPMSCQPVILPLSRLTAKKFRLNFRCSSTSFVPPPGTKATTFMSMAQINGFIQVKRTKSGG